MAVRALNGTSDDITCSAGAADSMTYGTFAFLIKQTANHTLENNVFALLTSGSAALRMVAATCSTNGASNNMQCVIFNGADYDQSGTITSGLNNWLLCVVRKGNGSVTPRWSVRNMSTGTWTHFNTGDTTIANWTSIGSSGLIRFYDTDQWSALRIAARALWANNVKWSADSTGDAAIEAAGLHTLASNWLTAAPDLLHFFDQASTATAITDLIGTANQTAISGTTVVTDDDPPGFTFDYASGANTGTADVGVAIDVAATGARASAGAANVGVAIDVAATGARTSAGSANVGVAIDVAATGFTPHTGTANVSLAIDLAATGSRASSSAVDVGIAIDVAATGDAPGGVSPNQGSANVSLAIDVAASGFTTHAGSANVGLQIDVAATGFTPHTGTADVGINLALAGTGRRNPVGTADVGISIDPAASGLTTRRGTANVSIDLDIQALGRDPSAKPPILVGALLLAGEHQVRLGVDHEVRLLWNQ